MPSHPYGLKKPCKNCPFLKVGAISLKEGRVEGIVSDLLAGRATGFSCHKTVHGRRGGDWVEDDDGNDLYNPSGNEQECAGALILLEKMGYRTPMMQVAERLGVYDPQALVPQYENIVEPGDLHPDHLVIPEHVKRALDRESGDEE